MTVYAFWEDGPDAPAEQPELVALWARGWKKRGWTPRLLTVRDSGKWKKGSTSAHDAMRASGATWICPLTVMNFAYTPNKKIPLFPGWHPMAELVDFAGWSVEKIVACGREI